MSVVVESEREEEKGIRGIDAGNPEMSLSAFLQGVSLQAPFSSPHPHHSCFFWKKFTEPFLLLTMTRGVFVYFETGWPAIDQTGLEFADLSASAIHILSVISFS